jgi:pyruvate-formate lyase-activating enzyme
MSNIEQNRTEQKTCICIYGAGDNGFNDYPSLASDYEILCYIDGDVNKQGKTLRSIPVLSLSQALVLYPDTLFYVSPATPVKYEICKILYKNGIDKTRILNYEENLYCRSCPDLRRAMLITNSDTQISFHYCCGLGNLRNIPARISFEDSATPEDTVTEFISYRDNLLKKIAYEEPSECEGCPAIKEGLFEPPKIGSISYSLYSPCNCNCIYCVAPGYIKRLSEHTKSLIRDFRLDLLLNQLETRNLIDSNTLIELSAGEITVNPNRAAILDTVKKYNVILFSSCIIYDNQALEVIKKPGSFLLTSLDCGTKSSFYTIKGVDAFDKVVANIRQYAASGANIHLKYIVLTQNCNDDDINGFIEICKEIKPQLVRISCDIKSDFKNLPPQILEFAIKLGRECLKNKLDFYVLEHFGGHEEYIKKEIYNNGK